jgi:hypothetical protein
LRPPILCLFVQVGKRNLRVLRCREGAREASPPPARISHRPPRRGEPARAPGVESSGASHPRGTFIMAEDIATAARADGAEGSAHRLIASNRVEGTAVYDRQGEKLGRIEYFMVDKVTGQADYAVMSFGGLFGLGGKHYPLPWDMLDYDPDKGGYVVTLDKDKLEKGPSFNAGEEPEFDRRYDENVYDYYGVIYTW